MKFKVQFLAGESRYSDEGVDYMLVELPNDEELYAEVDPADYLTDEERAKWEAILDAEGAYAAPCGQYFDTDERTYSVLKAAILEQAKEKGIPADRLIFYWD